MKDILVALAKSLLKTIVIAALVAAAGYYLVGYPFWGAFVVAFIVQFVLFYALNVWLEYKSIKDRHMLIIKEAEVLGRSTIKVECASCKKESDVVVVLNTDNQFTCGFCKVKNSVYINATTAVVTDPLYDKLPIPNTASTNGT
jgi:hypothetical protein